VVFTDSVLTTFSWWLEGSCPELLLLPPPPLLLLLLLFDILRTVHRDIFV
jgi:hypothetical protein